MLGTARSAASCALRKSGTSTSAEGVLQERARTTSPLRLERDVMRASRSFLQIQIEEIGKLEVRGLFGTFKEKIDAGEQNDWNPFA